MSSINALQGAIEGGLEQGSTLPQSKSSALAIQQKTDSALAIPRTRGSMLALPQTRGSSNGRVEEN